MPYIDAIVLRLTASIGAVGGPATEARHSGRTNYTIPQIVRPLEQRRSSAIR